MCVCVGVRIDFITDLENTELWVRIVYCLISVLIGLFLLTLGYRLFKFVVAFVGFLFGYADINHRSTCCVGWLVVRLLQLYYNYGGDDGYLLLVMMMMMMMMMLL